MRFIHTMLLSLTVFCAGAQTPERPRLVVGIIVDQMRPDYLVRFGDRFGKDGFRRILQQGHSCTDTRFNYAPTVTAAGHASVYTGTTPSVHGIAGNDWYDQRHEGVVYCTSDTSVRSVGNGDPLAREGRMSPHRLLTTSIADQLKLSTQFKAKVIGISLKDRGAILPAGRSADAAYWFDARSGNWISSTWYMNTLPDWAHRFNAEKRPDKILSQPWNTLYPIASYTASDPDNTPYENPFLGETEPVFPHNLPAIRGTSYELARRIPQGNTLTRDFALAAIEGEHLGKDSVTDFLCLSFSATDYVGHQFGPNAIETEDTYLRLDKDIAGLLAELDARVGKGQYLVFITADHACAENPKFMRDHRFHAGFIDNTEVSDTVKRLVSRLYGDTTYFKSFTNDQISLNTAAIQRDGRELCAVERQLAEGMQTAFEGIYLAPDACMLERESMEGSAFMPLIRNGHYRGRSGHIWLVYSPGWTEKLYSGDGTRGTTHGSPYPYDTHVPLLWYGWNIRPGKSIQEVSITDIAPTLSFLLGITLPNGCTGKKIESLLR